MSILQLVSRIPKDLSNYVVERTYRRGEHIIYPQEQNNTFYILKEGEAEVRYTSYDGVTKMLFRYEGDTCFGELEIFNNKIEPLEIVAVRESLVLSIEKDHLIQWMKRDFSVTEFLMSQLSEKLIDSSERVLRLSLLSIKERIVYHIYTHLTMGVLGDLTKADLCQLVGVPIRSLNRSLVECKEDGLIGYGKKRFSVLSVDKLEEAVEDLQL